jgi:biopolymer transport protein TolR
MRKRRLVNQINIVPYVDVMLVLLVIFMVTAPLVNPGVVDLPTLGKSSQPPVLPVEITVKADASLMLRQRVKAVGGTVEQVQERTVTTREMLQALRELQGRNPDQPVVIAADKNVRYEAVMKVMDELQRANVRRVGLLVKSTGS